MYTVFRFNSFFTWSPSPHCLVCSTDCVQVLLRKLVQFLNIDLQPRLAIFGPIQTFTICDERKTNFEGSIYDLSFSIACRTFFFLISGFFSCPVRHLYWFRILLFKTRFLHERKIAWFEFCVID